MYDVARPGAASTASNALKILNDVPIPLPRKNLVRIYGSTLVTKGSKAVGKALERYRRDTAHYDFDKDELIRLGYELIGDINPFRRPLQPRIDDALTVFQTCVRLFPEYWNSYDSYGDALARVGKTEQAIAMYRKSIEWNPQNEGGKKMLEKLQGR